MDGLILHGTRVFVPTTSASLPALLQLAHSAGYEGTQKSLHRLRQDFFIEHACRLVREFVSACATCQRNKTEHLQPAFFNLWRYRRRSGSTSRWTLLKAFRE